MSAADDAEANARFLSEIVDDVLAELKERFEIVLTGSDVLAADTALMKAAWRGFHRGVAAAHGALNEQAPEMQVWIDAPPGDPGEPDLWLEDQLISG